VLLDHQGNSQKRGAGNDGARGADGAQKKRDEVEFLKKRTACWEKVRFQHVVTRNLERDARAGAG